MRYAANYLFNALLFIGHAINGPLVSFKKNLQERRARRRTSLEQLGSWLEKRAYRARSLKDLDDIDFEATQIIIRYSKWVKISRVEAFQKKVDDAADFRRKEIMDALHVENLIAKSIKNC